MPTTNIKNQSSSLKFTLSKFGEMYLEEVNRNSFNVSCSKDVFYDKWANTLNKEYQFYIIIGTDSGLLMEYIASAPIAKGCFYIFIEDDSLLPIISKKPEIKNFTTEQKEKIYLCSLSNWLETARSLNWSQYIYLESSNLIYSTSVQSPEYKPYLLFRPQVEKNYFDLRKVYSSQLAKQIFIINQIKNIADLQLSASKLKNIAKNKTAVLLAGGPSLDDTLDWVKNNRENLIIVAVSRISKRLHQVNLVPDIIVTVDPEHFSYQVSKEMFYFQNKSILLYQYHTIDSLVKQWAGKKCYMGDAFPWKLKQKNESLYSPGPTVTHAALYVMLEMGCKRIIFGGVDLCFSQAGISHAKGSNEYDAGPILDKPTIVVTTNNDSEAETGLDYYQGINSLEVLAKKALDLNIELINPAPFAAKIKNIKHIEINKININDEISINKENLFKDIYIPNQQQRLKYYSFCRQQFKTTLYLLNSIKQLSMQAIDYNSLLFGINDKLGDFKYKIKLDKTEKQIQKKSKQLLDLIQHFALKEFVKFLTLKADDEETNQDLEDRANTYYQAFIVGCKYLALIIKEADTALTLRFEEENQNIDIKKIIANWNKTKYIGQSLRWRENHIEQYNLLDKPAQQSLQELELKFWQHIKKTEIIDDLKIDPITYWQQACFKVEIAFNIKDLAALLRLQNALEKYSANNDKAQSLLNLTSASINFLNNNKDQAIQKWFKVSKIKDYDACKIIALKQLIINSDNNELNDIYEELCKLEPQYNSVYARYLIIKQQYQKAVPYLLLALKQNPHSKRLLNGLLDSYKISNQPKHAAIIEKQIYRLTSA